MERSESDMSGKSLEDKELGGKQSRRSELRAACRIPSDEVLVDDFICAMKQTMIYQGRIYIFDHHLCFDSRLFGKEKLLSLPLKEVTNVKKRKFCGFPNSIEIFWHGRNYFFTSFLKRDEAYKVITYAWEKSRHYASFDLDQNQLLYTLKQISKCYFKIEIDLPYAKLFGGSGSSRYPNQSPDAKKLLGSRHLAKLVNRSYRSIEDQNEENSEESTDTKTEPSLQRPSASEMSSPEPTNAGFKDDYTDSDSDHESTVTESQDEMNRWQATTEPPPPIEPNMNKLVEAQLDVTVHTFYKEFLSDESQFFISWHETRGDTKVQLSEWRKHQIGYVRDLTFITPLKQKIGPSKCLCTQTQRTRLHQNNHLVFNTSQIMDIPYGDYFSVNTQWDIVPAEDNKACKVTIHLAIPFSKKTMFKSTIESNTKQLMTTAYEDWLSTARKWMEDPIPIPPEPPQSCFSNGESQQAVDNDGPTHFSRAQSLSMRLSREWLPDKDLVRRTPSAYRPEIARVLQYQESNTGLSKKEQGTGRKVSFDFNGNEQRKQSFACIHTFREHPAIWSVLGLLVLIQVLYSAWRWLGWLTPKFSAYLPDLSIPKWQPKLWNDTPEGSYELLHQDFLALKEQMREMKTILVTLHQQILNLQNVLGGERITP